MRSVYSSASIASRAHAAVGAPALGWRSPAGSWISTAAASWRVPTRRAAPVSTSTCRSYAPLKPAIDDGCVWEVSSGHAAGLLIGILALPVTAALQLTLRLAGRLGIPAAARWGCAYRS